MAGFELAIEKLKARGVKMQRGLSSFEMQCIEWYYGFRFPPDLREFLSLALPVSKNWVNWRSWNHSEIRKKLDLPLEELYSEIEYSDFWMHDWGKKPDTQLEHFKVARRAYSLAPKLIPIQYQCYIPNRPYEPGNPVFAVWQTDFSYESNDLIDHLTMDESAVAASRERRRIALWSDLLDAIETEVKAAAVERQRKWEEENAKSERPLFRKGEYYWRKKKEQLGGEPPEDKIE